MKNYWGSMKLQKQRPLINLTWHNNKWSKDKVATKKKYIEANKKWFENTKSKEPDKIKEVDGIVIINSDDQYGIYDKETGGTLGFGRTSFQEAEKDIPMLLKMEGGTSIHDPAVRKHLEEGIDWQIKNQNEMKEHNYRILRSKEKDYRTKQVLDIGAGAQPDMRATHAIDLQDPGKKWFDVRYTSGVDMNKNKLPYRDNQFHREISYASLGFNFGNDNTFKESYRVLKSNGTIEIGIPQTSDPSNIETTKNELSKSGFTDIRSEKKQLPNGGLFTVITAKKVG